MTENVKGDKPPIRGLVTMREPRQPINLDDYTSEFRKHLRRVGACACYIIGERERGPLKVGIASDVRARLRSLQDGTLLQLSAFYVLWTPGRPVAKRIEGYVHGLLLRAGRSVKGEWFNIDSESAIATLNWAARELYPNANLFSHDEVMGHLTKKYPPKVRLDRKAIDSFPEIRDKSFLADIFGSAPSDRSAIEPQQHDVATVIQDDIERRIDPEGYAARASSELARFRAEKGWPR